MDGRVGIHYGFLFARDSISELSVCLCVASFSFLDVAPQTQQNHHKWTKKVGFIERKCCADSFKPVPIIIHSFTRTLFHFVTRLLTHSFTHTLTLSSSLTRTLRSPKQKESEWASHPHCAALSYPRTRSLRHRPRRPLGALASPTPRPP